MFNNYIWDNYLQLNGNKTVEIFDRLIDNEISESAESYPQSICDFRNVYCPTEAIVSNTKIVLDELFEHLMQIIVVEELRFVVELSNEERYSINNVMKALYKGLDGKKGFEKDAFLYFVEGIEYYTTALYCLFPECFIPYYFQFNFNVLERIFKEFNIEMPDIPQKKDYKGRLFFYGDICAALYEFRTENNLSPAELCAFLYDFAPKCIGGTESYIVSEPPKPKRAFFVGGSSDDAFIDEEITPWQCNPETKAGDIAVMYLKSPVSAIDTIFRCVSDGFVDPFFLYYKCAYISKSQKINRIPWQEIKVDPILSEMPIVRKNMQDLGGVEIFPSQYNHIVDLSGGEAPKIKFTAIRSGVELSDERDVEEKLIKKLLSELGYNESQYIRQLRIEIGNHNSTLIPDFLLLYDETRGHQKAFAVIEAKYEIPEKELCEVEIQTRSYARQVLAKYSVIASKDKIRVYSAEDDFTEIIFQTTWRDINKSDVRTVLYKLIGNK